MIVTSLAPADGAPGGSAVAGGVGVPTVAAGLQRESGGVGGPTESSAARMNRPYSVAPVAVRWRPSAVLNHDVLASL